MTAHRLFTWQFRAALAAERRLADVTLVRISLGKPKWLDPGRAAAMPYISELAPHGLFHLWDADEFRRRYRERLDGFGVARIERRLREVINSNGGRPLVLLCYEPDRRACHRGDFADWWRDRTGELVPEFRLDG